MAVSQMTLTGRGQDHIRYIPELQVYLHYEVVAPLLELKAQAAKEGFTLAVASAFRSHHRQIALWNGKARGKRPLLDMNCRHLRIEVLTPEELLYSILRWTALPGASRHHWGTDFDVYDAAACPPGYQVQLTPAEAQNLFGAFHSWLNDRMQSPDFPFYRPYDTYRGGVAAEPWHLSYAPLSRPFKEAYTYQTFLKVMEETAFDLEDLVMNNAQEIYEKFVINTA
jgi:LAS superfamily LD-carboxypeptidase LdcB